MGVADLAGLTNRSTSMVTRASLNAGLLSGRIFAAMPLGVGAGEVDGKDEVVNLVEGERGVTNNPETSDNFSADSFEYAGETDLGCALWPAGCTFGACYVAGVDERIFKLSEDDSIDVRCVAGGKQEHAWGYVRAFEHGWALARTKTCEVGA